MATEISVDCSDLFLRKDKEKSQTNCHYHQQLSRKLTLATVVFISLCFLQFYWNIRLNREIYEVRSNIDYLLSKCQRSNSNSAAESAYFESDVIIPHDNEENNEIENNKAVPTLKQSVFKPMRKSENYSVSFTSGGYRHVIAKRSSGVKHKKCKLPKERSLMKMFRKQGKAIAFHVAAKRPPLLDEAGQPAFNPNPSVTGPSEARLPGQTIKTWEIPEDANNSKFNLCFLNSEGYIRVPVTGYYYIYGQVIFTTTSSTTMAAEIGVGNYGETQFTKCLLTNHATKKSWTTCNVNGVKKLQRGAAISLMVHPQNVHVYMSPEYTYFGAVLVGL